MKTLSAGSAAVAALSLLATTASGALNPIVGKGQKFFDSKTGEQFFMRGVAYQTDLSNVSDLKEGQTYKDPLADVTACRRDIALLEELRTNIIRVYAIDPDADHSECMKILDDAGIYVIADLSEPALSINRDAPQWDLKLWGRYAKVIDELAKYDNTFGFFAGNEVTNNATNANASPFVKAAVRDMKSYIKTKGYRPMPVGYATNDDEEIRDPMMAYFNCGPAEESIDFWGYNIYSWCGKSSLQISGWDKHIEEYREYNVPVFLAEYGCNKVRPRLFTEVEALYGPQMTPVFSGGIVYMFHEEANEFGLVKIDGNKDTPLKDFDNLKDQMSSVDPTGVNMNSYTPSSSLKARACPANDASWAASTVLPPSPDSGLCDCAKKSFACLPAEDLDEENYGEIFGFICGALGENGCQGISANGTAGVYGSFSMCDAETRLGWALNQYYEFQNSASDACDFNGQARVVTPSTDGSCDQKIESAGGQTGTTGGGDSNGSGSGSGNDENSGFSLQVPALLSMISVLAAGLLL